MRWWRSYAIDCPKEDILQKEEKDVEEDKQLQAAEKQLKNKKELLEYVMHTVDLSRDLSDEELLSLIDAGICEHRLKS